MIGQTKLRKLIERIEGLMLILAKHPDKIIYENIDLSFYHLKIQSMNRLLFQYEMPAFTYTTTDTIRIEYTAVFYQWRKDVRWLNSYLRQRPQTKAIL